MLLGAIVKARRGDLSGATEACARVVSSMADDQLRGGAVDFCLASASLASLLRDRSLSAPSPLAAQLLSDAAKLLATAVTALGERLVSVGFLGLSPLTIGGSRRQTHGTGSNLCGADMRPPMLDALLQAAASANAFARDKSTSKGGVFSAEVANSVASFCDASDAASQAFEPSPLVNLYHPEVVLLSMLLAAQATLSLDQPNVDLVVAKDAASAGLLLLRQTAHPPPHTRARLLFVLGATRRRTLFLTEAERAFEPAIQPSVLAPIDTVTITAEPNKETIDKKESGKGGKAMKKDGKGSTEPLTPSTPPVSAKNPSDASSLASTASESFGLPWTHRVGACAASLIGCVNVSAVGGYDHALMRSALLELALLLGASPVTCLAERHLRAAMNAISIASQLAAQVRRKTPLKG